MSYLIGAIPESDYDAMHYGVKRRSGRYPWGSGETPYQHEAWFLNQVKELKNSGYTETEIAEWFDVSTKTLRAWKSIANAQQVEKENAEILKLKEKGYSNVEIGKRLGKNESVIRSRLDGMNKEQRDTAMQTADALKKRLGEIQYLDIGTGTERWMGVSKEKLNTAVAILEEEGYVVRYLTVEQMGTGKKTSMKILCPPGTSWSEMNANRDKIGNIEQWSNDNGTTFQSFKYPVSIDPKRVAVRYPEEGGDDLDGTIQLRRGVEDISLGENHYAQVRIAVGGTHYMKGVAMYAEDEEFKKFPKGVDIIYNTHYDKDRPMMGEDNDHSVMKLMKSDPTNPFGATCKNHFYTDKDGVEVQSPINLINEEGTWGTWSKTLSSQFLSKQPVKLAERQLKLDLDYRKADFEEIMSIDNEIVREYMLNKFADECDAAAVDLKAASMPRQTSSVLLPVRSLKEDEIYAPNYNNGEKVVLIRYPHSGKFEIPLLTVNNRNEEARKAIGIHSTDAVGISKSAAVKLSGADFDGDTAIVIPNNSGEVLTGSLKALKNFDPQVAYKGYEGMPRVGKSTGFNKQLEMGKVSNLITDMTIKGADEDEIARAVKHSMVVIDAEKHNLDWRRSETENDIPGLKEKYQGGKRNGASTLISKASGRADVDQRNELTYISKNKMTEQDIADFKAGKRVYEYTGGSYTKTDANGRTHTYKRKTTITKMEKVDDARELMSNDGVGTKIEQVYADYANSNKAMAIEARRVARLPKTSTYSPEARKKYDAEYQSLKAQLTRAQKNAPLERAAQLFANIIVDAKKAANPELRDRDHKEELTKIKNQAIAEGRERTGAHKKNVMVTFSDREWEAIQAGAISGTFLKDLLTNANMEDVVKLATPRISSSMSIGKIDRAVAMLQNGFTQAEVADEFGVSASTLMRNLKEAGRKV